MTYIFTHDQDGFALCSCHVFLKGIFSTTYCTIMRLKNCTVLIDKCNVRMYVRMYVQYDVYIYAWSGWVCSLQLPCFSQRYIFYNVLHHNQVIKTCMKLINASRQKCLFCWTLNSLSIVRGKISTFMRRNELYFNQVMVMFINLINPSTSILPQVTLCLMASFLYGESNVIQS